MDQPQGRFELVRGQVVAMSPEPAGHVRAKGSTYRALEDAIAASGLGCEAFPDGMTVRIDGGDYVVVEQSADRRRLLLAGAGGIVDVGDGYQGIYKFDTVTVRNGAVLEFLDPAEVGTWDVDANSQVIQP